MSVNGTPLVEVEHLVKRFPVKQGVFARARGEVHAVEDVSLTVRSGETLGLVGESGCGKSTTARLILRLIDSTAGTIRFDGRDITKLSQHSLRPIRREMQMVFQDPYSALNPRKTIGQIVGAPFAIHRTEKDSRKRVRELLDRVGLSPEHYNRYPHEFSGGQRQRIGVARALALQPKLIVCDEPVSALDVSIQAQILNLLRSLQHEFNLTYIFISHDLAVIRQICDRIAVMYLGHVVETGESAQIFDNPLHPYTIALLSAVPHAGSSGDRRIVLRGDLPSPINPPPACIFHTRCPYVQPTLCREEAPPLRELERGHLAACHWAERIKDGKIKPHEREPVFEPPLEPMPETSARL
jgi:oligopeptide/dipeptide ABC transporter ATP-binding protein